MASFQVGGFLPGIGRGLFWGEECVFSHWDVQVQAWARGVPAFFSFFPQDARVCKSSWTAAGWYSIQTEAKSKPITEVWVPHVGEGVVSGELPVWRRCIYSAMTPGLLDVPRKAMDSCHASPIVGTTSAQGWCQPKQSPPDPNLATSLRHGCQEACLSLVSQASSSARERGDLFRNSPWQPAARLCCSHLISPNNWRGLLPPLAQPCYAGATYMEQVACTERTSREKIYPLNREKI